MSMNPQLLPNDSFNQVVIADLSHFQIAIPTTSRLANRRFLSTWMPIPERTYATYGWLVYDQKIAAHIKGLQIASINTAMGCLKPLKRLTASIPVSFQTETVWPLPQAVSEQSVFTYKVPDEIFAYRAVFRQRIPRFTRIYSFEDSLSLLDKVEQMLMNEALFISQNHERLRQVPFYQKYFGLE
ncbi:MAG: hypothetical protein AAFW84_07620 [Cyanobacteria bacterium J06635_15]